MDTSSIAIVLEDAPCPRCGTHDSETIYRARDVLYGIPGEYRAARCRRCGLWFQNPRPARESLAALYPPDYGPHAAASPSQGQAATAGAAPRRRLATVVRAIRHAWRRGHIVHGLGYRAWEADGGGMRLFSRIAATCFHTGRWKADVDLIPRFVPNGRLLELGAGTGARLARLRDMGWQDVRGVELVPAAAAAARQKGLDVMTAPVEDALSGFPDDHFDVILSSMVLEHLLNPFTTVQAIARKLKPGGELLFSTVIRDSVDGWIFGPYGVSYDFPRHMVFFRKRDLLEMLDRDFCDVRCVHDQTPIDFQRPARLRGRRIDWWILRLFRVPGAASFVWLLAQLGLMGRVSFRCRRKQA